MAGSGPTRISEAEMTEERGEVQQEALDKELQHTLDEARTVIPGSRHYSDFS